MVKGHPTGCGLQFLSFLTSKSIIVCFLLFCWFSKFVCIIDGGSETPGFLDTVIVHSTYTCHVMRLLLTLSIYKTHEGSATPTDLKLHHQTNTASFGLGNNFQGAGSTNQRAELN